MLEGEAGRVVFPADGTILQAEELVLFVPRESPEDDHELQLLLSTGDAGEGAVDRWRAYHGSPRLNGFGAFAIEGAKYGPTLELAFRIARVFNKPVDAVFWWEEES